MSNGGKFDRYDRFSFPERCREVVLFLLLIMFAFTSGGMTAEGCVRKEVCEAQCPDAEYRKYRKGRCVCFTPATNEPLTSIKTVPVVNSTQ